MKLNKESYTKEEVKNLLIKMLSYCEIKINTTNKEVGEFGFIPIQVIREDIKIVKEEIKNYQGLYWYRQGYEAYNLARWFVKPNLNINANEYKMAA